MKIKIQQKGKKFENCTISGSDVPLENISSLTLLREHDKKFLTVDGHFSAEETNLDCTFSKENNALVISGKYFKVVNLGPGTWFLVSLNGTAGHQYEYKFSWPHLAGEAVEITLQRVAPLDPPDLTIVRQDNVEEGSGPPRETKGQGLKDESEKAKKEIEILKDELEKAKETISSLKEEMLGDKGPVPPPKRPQYLHASIGFFIVSLTCLVLAFNKFQNSNEPYLASIDATETECIQSIIASLRASDETLKTVPSRCKGTLREVPLMSALVGEAQSQPIIFKYIAQYYAADVSDEFWGSKIGLTTKRDPLGAIEYFAKAFSTGHSDVYDSFLRECNELDNIGDMADIELAGNDCKLVLQNGN